MKFYTLYGVGNTHNPYVAHRAVKELFPDDKDQNGKVLKERKVLFRQFESHILVLTEHEPVVKTVSFLPSTCLIDTPSHVIDECEIGDTFMFSMDFNPSTRVPTGTVKSNGKPKRKRIGINGKHKIRKWFVNKIGNQCGFTMEHLVVSNERFIKCKKDDSDLTPKQYKVATINGLLTITDIGAFKRFLVTGLGQGKAYGLGMLDVISG